MLILLIVVLILLFGGGGATTTGENTGKACSPPAPCVPRDGSGLAVDDDECDTWRSTLFRMAQLEAGGVRDMGRGRRVRS